MAIPDVGVSCSAIKQAGLTNPVTVDLTIGNNRGTTSVDADF
jgi:hypothetical protein